MGLPEVLPHRCHEAADLVPREDGPPDRGPGAAPPVPRVRRSQASRAGRDRSPRACSRGAIAPGGGPT
eukprot:251781-Alexandrium_andersonii.AAC.1